MSIRITNHSARGGADGPFLPGHNDRSKTQNAEHINKEKSNLNFYYTVTGIPDFEKNELVFYEKKFSQHLELQNQRYKKNRHKEKIKTMEEYLKGKYTRPDETILQIGNKDDHPDPEISKSIILEFMQWHQDEFPDIVILDLAIHNDESTPHAHVRSVYTSVDQDGCIYPNQKKCLEGMGILPPDPSKKRSRFNNAKQTYTSLCREKLIQISREHGLTIEDRPKHPSKTGLSLLEYKTQQEEIKYKGILEQAKDLDSMLEFISQNQDRYIDFIERQERSTSSRHHSKDERAKR